MQPRHVIRGAEAHLYIRIRQEGNMRNTGYESHGVRLGIVGRVDGLQVRESATPKVRVRRAKALVEVKIRFTRGVGADDVQRTLRRDLGKCVRMQAMCLESAPCGKRCEPASGSC